MNSQSVQAPLSRQQGAVVASLLLHAAFFLLGRQTLGNGTFSQAVPLAPVFNVSLVVGAVGGAPQGVVPKAEPVAVGKDAANSWRRGERLPTAVRKERPPSPPVDISSAAAASPSPAASGGGAPVIGTGAGGREGQSAAGSTDPVRSEGGHGGITSASKEGAGGEVAVPLYQRNPPPVYPRLARQRRDEGVVFLRVLVLADGSVGNLRVEKTSGYPLLDQAALGAVRGWAFVPGRRDGKSAAMEVLVPVRFALE